jgi:16S rRNA U516 pseudouridylate synthase RsuA-like enzyme
MFGVFGLGVNALTRASIGLLELDKSLGLGECREMTKKEVLLAEEKNTCNI